MAFAIAINFLLRQRFRDFDRREVAYLTLLCQEFDYAKIGIKLQSAPACAPRKSDTGTYYFYVDPAVGLEIFTATFQSFGRVLRMECGYITESNVYQHTNSTPLGNVVTSVELNRHGRRC
ncbi:MAG: hypothetical protein HOP09_18585 [Hyphomicrobium sp.]|nr:hypothetical protein [Hyphomicrobium sp.]